MKNYFISSVLTGIAKPAISLSIYPKGSRQCLLLIGLLLSIALPSQAQLYYALSDGAFATRNDEVRRIGLDGTGDVQIATNYIDSPGVIAIDPANNRIFVAEIRATSPSIVRVDRTTGANSIFLPLLANNAPTGLAVDQVNGYLYYAISDGAFATTNDQLRRIKLDGTGDELIATGFAEVIGAIALDLPNNRVFVADTRTSAGASQIFAVNLTTKVATEFTNNTLAIRGLAVDRVNSTLYYIVDDGAATTNNDQLRRVKLNGTGDELVATNFVNSTGPLAVDQVNNRVLVADVRANLPKIYAVDISTKVATLFFTPSVASRSLSGIAIFEQAPAVTTAGVTGVGSSSAIAGGNVTSAGSSTVTGRGVVYSSTNTTPALGSGTSTSVTIGSGTGNFSQTISGLNPTTTYYLRAYATNAAGTSYGAVQTFTTTVANTAPTVANVIPPQSATVSQSFSFTIPANTFTDAQTPGSLSLTVSGLPGGFSFTSPATISGTASTTVGSPFSVTVTATDPGGLSVSTTFTLSIKSVAPMPVRLVRFGAQQLATGSVGLSWETSWEQNTAWFDVQRSDNAREFGLVGKIAATGESSQRQQYSFEDRQTPVQTVYYRLRIVDKDGSFAYSSIVAVSVDPSRLLLTILGNPTQHTLRLLVNSPVAQPLELSLQTVSGQVVNRRDVRITAGQTSLDMDVTNLAAGTYLLLVNNGTSRYVKRVLIN